MKRGTFLVFCVILLTACSINPETKVISDYLEGYGKDIGNYRVIFFVPADGCSSCVETSLTYSETTHWRVDNMGHCMFRKRTTHLI